MKNSSKKFVALVLLVAIGGGGYVLYNKQNEALLPEGIAFGNGRIEAVQVDISTRIPGRVKQILLREGDLVFPDQSVAQIDTAQLQAQKLRATAEVASISSQIAGARARVAEAEAHLAFTQQELNRIDPLVKKQLISRDAYDSQISKRDMARASLNAAKAVIVSTQRAEEAARAIVTEIETQITDCNLLSPAFGRVLYRLAEPGEVLGAGGKVMTIIKMEDIYMEFFLPSSQAHLVSVGNEARIKLDVLEYVLPAMVSFVSPESQFTPKQVETQEERDKLMFRIKVSVPPELVHQYIDKVKTGVRGIAYVQLDNRQESDWSSFLPPLVPTTQIDADIAL